MATLSVSSSYTQSVGLLGWGIRPSQGLYLPTEQHKHRINAYNADIHALSGIGTHDPSVRQNEDGSCLRPRGPCDRHTIKLRVLVTGYSNLLINLVTSCDLCRCCTPVYVRGARNSSSTRVTCGRFRCTTPASLLQRENLCGGSKHKKAKRFSLLLCVFIKRRLHSNMGSIPSCYRILRLRYRSGSVSLVRQTSALGVVSELTGTYRTSCAIVDQEFQNLSCT
jgi:hypothetical protein